MLVCKLAESQNVAGYWYGTASVANGKNSNNYLVELILKQNSNSIKGIINYYFKNTFRSLQIKGNYDARSRQVALYHIPVPYFGSTSQLQLDCSMDFIATHRIAKAGSDLIGRFVGEQAYKFTCPDIVFDLKLNKDAGNQDSILTALKNFKETNQLWTPSATDTLVAATVIQRKVENIVIDKEYKRRENILQNEITVASDSIKVDFYDNGEVDGDSISVYFNDQLLGANLRLSTKAIHLNLTLDTSKEVNILAMFANNLGTIPPNTALMLVYDGTKRYEIRLSSNLEQNAVVRIRRRKKAA
ncbi:MAG: hypothetical protein NVSMB67_15790 [Flavisolibacter sp.]